MPARAKEDLDLAELDDYAELVGRYVEADAAQKRWLAEREDIRTELLHLIGERDGASVGGAMVLRRVHSEGSERVDAAKLRKHYPDVYVTVLSFSQPYDVLRIVS